MKPMDTGKLTPTYGLYHGALLFGMYFRTHRGVVDFKVRELCSGLIPPNITLVRPVITKPRVEVFVEVFFYHSYKADSKPLTTLGVIS